MAVGAWHGLAMNCLMFWCGSIGFSPINVVASARYAENRDVKKVCILVHYLLLTEYWYVSLIYPFIPL